MMHENAICLIKHKKQRNCTLPLLKFISSESARLHSFQLQNSRKIEVSSLYSTKPTMFTDCLLIFGLFFLLLFVKVANAGMEDNGCSYRLAVIVDPRIDNAIDNHTRIREAINDAVTIDSRRKTRFSSQDSVKRDLAAMTISCYDSNRTVTKPIGNFVNLHATIVPLRGGYDMYNVMMAKSETAKGKLLTVIDGTPCSKRNCNLIWEAMENLPGTMLMTSCCYSRPAQRLDSGSTNNSDDDDGDEDDDTSAEQASFTDPPNTIFDGIEPELAFRIADQLSERFNWRRFHFIISPFVSMFDRYIDRLFAYFKSRSSKIVLTKSFYCTRQLAQTGVCRTDQARHLLMHKATVIFLLLEQDEDLIDFMNQASQLKNDTNFSRGKSLILLSLAGGLSTIIDGLLDSAPPGLMIATRKLPLFNTFQNSSMFGLKNADLAPRIYHEVRTVAKAVDIFAANQRDFKQFSIADANNESAVFTKHCDVHNWTIEIWNVKEMRGVDDDDSDSYLEKVFEVSLNSGLITVGVPLWFGSRSSTPVENECDFNANAHCPPPLEVILPPSIVGSAFFAVLTMMVAILIHRVARKRQSVQQRTKDSVILSFSEIEFIKQPETSEMDYSSVIINSNNSSHADRRAAMMETPEGGKIRDVANSQDLLKSGKTVTAKFRGENVVVSLLSRSNCLVDDTLIKELLQIKELHHPNLNQFIGITPDPFRVCSVHECCAKGTLAQVLARKTLQLNRLFKVSFVSDIASGMAYLHQSGIQSHGELTADNVLVDARWFCKISNIPLPRLKQSEADSPTVSEHQIISIPHNKSSLSRSEHQSTYDSMPPEGTNWTPPELLRIPERNRPYRGSQKGDVYSYGIILFQVATRMSHPYTFYDLPDKVILNRVRAGTYPPFRPLCPPDEMPDDVMDLIALAQSCWEEVSVFRPSFPNIVRILQKMNNGKETQLVDEMIVMMENYAENLEATVNARTRELADEQHRSDELLSKMLPRSIIEELKAGRIVHPETYESVTVYFSDIVGFTALAAASSALEIVNFLNDLYSEFDHVIDSYNVYKVETIGDAYMVAGGLPIRNKMHASEIATMALDILSRVTTFHIRHRPGKLLQLRSGMHSGSVVAGIVGLKMPRYCLFGDTVNYASRMESSGLALRIHVSPDSKVLLDAIGGFKLEKRGWVTMKGKGTIETYHLIGKEGFTKTLPDISLAASIEEHEFK